MMTMPAALIHGLILVVLAPIAMAQTPLRIIDLTPDKPIPLGRGISSLNGEPRGDCVEHSPIAGLQLNGQIVTYQSKLITSRQEFQEFIEASASIQAGGIAGWNASASATYSNQISINSYDVDYVARVTVQNQGQVLQNVALKPEIIVRIAREAQPLKWFLDACGDSYVNKIVSGGELVANLHLSTKSVQETTQTSAQLKGATLTFSASGDFSKTVSSLSQAGALNISMFRTGGAGLELPGSLDTLTEQVRQFPAKMLPGAAPLRAITQSYKTVINLPNSIRVPLTQSFDQLGLLVSAYNKVRDELDRVNYVTQNADQFYLDPFDIPTLAVEASKLIERRDVLKERIRRCIEKTEQCDSPIPPSILGTVYPGRR